MKTITITELKENINTFIRLGQQEKIEVVNEEKTVFYITPERIKITSEWDNLFGILPREAYNDEDIKRE